MYEYVATLMSNARKQTLSSDWVNAMAKTLKAERTHWLTNGEACDLHWSVEHPYRENARQGFVWSVVEMVMDASFIPYPTSIAHAEEIIRGKLGALPFDVVVQPVATRRKKLLICDMDSTMITVECIDELADFVGKKAEVSRITERAMNGEIDFAQALTERVRLLKGLPESTLQQCYDERVRLMPGALELVKTMREDGGHTVLVSGGFTFFTSRVREALGFHEDFSNELVVKDGVLTGEVAEPILGREAKHTALLESCQKLGITTDAVLAIGDGANDVPMLLAAGLGIAYHGKPAVQAAARYRISHADLRGALWAQGYSL